MSTATAASISLTPFTTGTWHVPNIPPKSGKTASALLQENHDKYHMYFNESGFHNHIAHHLLTIFALGATPDELQRAFDVNKDDQRPQFPVDQGVVDDMGDPKKFHDFLGQEKYFHDWEAFFRQEMEKNENGWHGVLQEFLFKKDDERAEALFVRMYAGFLHPIIHLGFGIEFQQPAIIVEALAQAAIHDSWVGPYLLGAERKAAAAAASDTKSKTLVQLIHEIRANDKIRNSPHWDDGNKVREGVIARAGEEMMELASQWTVSPAELSRKTAEMTNAAAWFTGAAQRADKMPKFDFFYMHSLNCSVFFSAFLKEEWMEVEDKCRLLEWKGRMDLAMYASRGSPELVVDLITEYKPKRPDDGWDGIIRRVDKYEDDGHASKIVRAFANGETVCRGFEDGEDFMIKGGMWEKLGHMAIDSVEGEGPRWIRNAGFERAWEEVPNKPKL